MLVDHCRPPSCLPPPKRFDRRYGAEGIVRAEPVFSDGDLVRVRRGPLAGLVGVVNGKVNGRGRVAVLMELLRRNTRVELPVGLLESARM